MERRQVEVSSARSRIPCTQPVAEFTLYLLLHRDGKPAETKPLDLEFVPLTVYDLKEQIQSSLNIPIPCQKIYFALEQLYDHNTLSSYRIRYGDTLHLHFNSEADVSAVRERVRTLEEATVYLDSVESEILHRNTSQYHFIDEHMTNNNVSHKTRELQRSFFNPLTSERSKANVACFIHYGGVNQLTQLHAKLLQYSWEQSPVLIQELEIAVLAVMWKMSAMVGARMYLLDPCICDRIVRSALRVEIELKKEVLAPTHVLQSLDASQQNEVLQKVIFEAVGVLCNLAEITSCGAQLASNQNLLQQLTAIILSPSFNNHSQLIVMAGLVCLAYNPKTHPHLAQVPVINNVLEICKDRKGTQLLQYFSALLLAQLIITSLTSIPEETVFQIFMFLRKFLRGVTPLHLHRLEMHYNFFWFTLRPHMTLAYCPLSPFCNVQLQPALYQNGDAQYLAQELHHCCIELGIVSLKNMLMGEEHKKVLVEEGLLDFVMCLPWYLPANTPRQRSAYLLKNTLKKLLVEPPSLLNIARAKLAITSFRLDYILTKSVRELLQPE